MEGHECDACIGLRFSLKLVWVNYLQILDVIKIPVARNEGKIVDNGCSGNDSIGRFNFPTSPYFYTLGNDPGRECQYIGIFDESLNNRFFGFVGVAPRQGFNLCYDRNVWYLIKDIGHKIHSRFRK